MSALYRYYEVGGLDVISHRICSNIQHLTCDQFAIELRKRKLDCMMRLSFSEAQIALVVVVVLTIGIDKTQPSQNHEAHLDASAQKFTFRVQVTLFKSLCVVVYLTSYSSSSAYCSNWRAYHVSERSVLLLTLPPLSNCALHLPLFTLSPCS
jgi:hypothetical protein